MDDLKTLDILIQALNLLDNLLVAEDQEPIEVRAIGGFALAYRNIRDFAAYRPPKPPKQSAIKSRACAIHVLA